MPLNKRSNEGNWGQWFVKDNNGNWIPIFKAETPDIQDIKSPTISVNGEVVAKLNVSDFCGEITLSDEAAAQLWATVEGGIEIVESRTEMKYIVKYHTDGSDEIIADKYEIVGPIVKMNSDGVEVAQDLYRRALFTDKDGVVAEINMQYVRGIFTYREDPKEKTKRICYDPLFERYGL